jgi:ribonuclease Z
VHQQAGTKTSADLMRPSLHPRLVNGPFDDPGLFVSFLYEPRAFLFDLGDLTRLTSRDLLKVTHVFVTHTHMDHFAGFDTLLRLYLGRNKTLYLYGPAGFLKNIQGKLAGYSWNLVANYQNLFTIVATEIHPGHRLTQTYVCHAEFQPAGREKRQAFKGTLVNEPGLRVSAAVLDHGIPCLGFRLEEKFHINIKKDALEDLGLSPGPWLNRFKQALYEKPAATAEFVIPARYAPGPKVYGLHELASQIALQTPGQKISYVVDVGYTLVNTEKIIALAKDSDQLFIEAAFLEKDKDIARQKQHLTAWQAGTLAAQAQVKSIIPLHFSPRYTGQGDQLYAEAMAAFQKGL